MYSGHDTTLIPCLMALGIFDMRWPPYAADITLEVHQHRQTKKAFVKVSYIGQVGTRSVSMSNSYAAEFGSSPKLLVFL